ncbi:hypothetical protein BDB01DRAFT_880973 [Pilobolus umbonatus]|nr:hypothetical protein BDB01DRAFT_880973 [Pilobolus umbonatus]
MSWDLGSLMIKPVQRVLKYPLLLRELLSVTSPTHHDHDDLLAALKEMEEVADNINEIKRRKDIVEKIVGDKKKTEISAQQFKQATGLAIEPTHDLLFESMHAQFEEQQEDIRQFARDIQGWVRHVKVSFEHMQQLSGSMKSLYNSWGGVRVKSLHSVDDFNRMSNYLFNIFSRELDNDVRSFVYSHIDELLRVYENPNQVIHKRSLKMIDYDRVRDMKSKGDIPDKSLQESADAYVSINAQLVEELPQFFLLTSKYFDIILKEWTTVQVKYFNIMKKETQNLIQRHLDLSSISSYEQIISHNQHQLQKLEPLINDITIINKRKSYQNSLPSSLSSQGFYSLAESDNDVTPPTSSVYSHLSVPPPDTRSSSHEFKCVVLYDFETHEEDMLNVKRGTLLRINQDEYDPNDGWWYATTVDDTQSGLIPISYCRRL